MRPSAARNRRPSNDRLIHLELFTDFFNEIGHERPICDVCSMSAYPESAHSARFAKQLWKLLHVSSDPPRLAFAQQCSFPRSDYGGVWASTQNIPSGVLWLLPLIALETAECPL